MEDWSDGKEQRCRGARLLKQMQELQRAEETGDLLLTAFERLLGRYVNPDEKLSDLMAELERRH